MYFRKKDDEDSDHHKSKHKKKKIKKERDDDDQYPPVLQQEIKIYYIFSVHSQTCIQRSLIGTGWLNELGSWIT
jgi:hypothetical protein